MTKMLITGGAGFVGQAIAGAAQAAGHDVSLVDSLDVRVHPADTRFDGVRADVRDATAWGDLLDVDVVFHEAATVGIGRDARDFADYADVNVTGTLRLLQALAERPEPPRIVLASSMAVYGEGATQCPACGEGRPVPRRTADLDAGRWENRCACGEVLEPRPTPEEKQHRPATAYAMSKSWQEQAALLAGSRLGIEVIALRYHNVYGPNMPRDTPYAGVASLFRSRLAVGLPPLVHEDGGQLRDFVHVSDVAQANLLAADAGSGAVGRCFNVGSGHPVTILQVARALADAVDGPAPVFSGSYRAGDARHVYGAIGQAHDVLGYRPRMEPAVGIAAFAHDPLRGSPA